jgi:hypothetical protein
MITKNDMKNNISMRLETEKEGVLQLSERHMDDLRIAVSYCALHFSVPELNSSEFFRKFFVLILYMSCILGMKCMKLPHSVGFFCLLVTSQTRLKVFLLSLVWNNIYANSCRPNFPPIFIASV